MAWKPTEADKARAAAEWRGILAGLELARADARLAAKLAKRRKTRPGSAADQFLRLLTENPTTPAARINAMLPKPMDPRTARKLAAEWRSKF